MIERAPGSLTGSRLVSSRRTRFFWHGTRRDAGGTLAPAVSSGYTGRVVEPKINSCWRKARIAARLLLKKEGRRPWNARDRALAAQFARDDGVTNRLIDQAIHGFRAFKKNGRSILDN